MNFQEMFDVAINNLINQARVAMVDGNFCRLRGRNGAKCAVGWLIPDSIYNKELEADTVEELFHNPALNGLFSNTGKPDYAVVEFLIELQECHDECKDCEPGATFVLELKRRAKLLAHSYSLEWKFG